MRAQFVFSEMWIGLRRNLTMTVALIVVVAISLSLLGTGLLFVKQVNKTRAFWQGRMELSVYLCSPGVVSSSCAKTGPITAAEQSQLQQTLQKMPQVTQVIYIPQQKAYQQFKAEFPSMVSSVSSSEIPSSFQVRLRNAETGASIVGESVGGAPGVADIQDNAAILNRFYRLLDGTRNAVIVIAIILVIAAVLLVANTVRLSAFNRRRETSIMRLVGASNFYVQLPFLVEGVISGLFGWLVASALLIAIKSLWLNTLQQYFKFNVQLSTTDLVEVIVLALVVGVVLTGATSLVTLRRYLRV